MIDRVEFIKRKEQYHPQQNRSDHKQQYHLKQGTNLPHGGGASIQQQQQQYQADVAYTLASASSAAAGAGGDGVVAAMRDPSNRTKAVVRHLPPSLSQSAFLEQIESRFAGLYNWVSFYPGKLSHKGSTYSRAYIDFKRPEDVFEFYEAFDGHIFVNEKGTQYKALVEYAPYQRVPKPWSKKDVREGTIFKDPEYLEFLEMLAKPVEFLPSAEVQLERREAERNSILAATGAKEAVIVTPLMEYVRQKRASKAAPQRSLSTSGKLSVRGGGSAPTTSSNMISKRGADRSRANAMYLPSQVTTRLKEKSTYVPRREENQRRERESVVDKKRREAFEVKEKKLIREIGSPKVVLSNQDVEAFEDSGDMNVKDILEATSGADTAATSMGKDDVEPHGFRGSLTGKASSSFEVISDLGKDGRDGRDLSKKKVLLLKEKEKESLNGVMAGSSVLIGDGSSGAHTPRHRPTTSGKNLGVSLAAQQGVTSPGRGGSLASSFKPSQRRDAGGRLGRGVSSSRDSMSFQQQRSSVQTLLQSDQQVEKDKRPPRPQGLRANAKEFSSIPVSPASVSEFESGLQQSNLGSTRFTDEKGEMTYGSGAERQDGRRVRNKDRPDRPVWTVRRRADAPPGPDSLLSLPAGSSTSPPREVVILTGSSETNMKPEKSSSQFRNGGKVGLVGGERGGESYQDPGQHDSSAFGIDSGSGSSGALLAGKIRCIESATRISRGSFSQDQASGQGDMKNEVVLLSRSSDVKAQGVSRSMNIGHENGDSSVQTPPSIADKERRKQEALAYWNELGAGNHRQVRRDRNSHNGAKDAESSLVLDVSKPAKRGGGASVYGGHEKQVWVAKSGSGS